MTARELLSKLESVRRVKGGWQARCPGHEDDAPSLSVTEKDNKVLLHCHAGCTPQAIIEALGLQMSDLFTDSARKQKAQTKRDLQPVTVADLARAKMLPLEFLEGELGVEDQPGHVLIPYFLVDSSLAPRQRWRTALVAKEGSLWSPGKGDITAYGLWRLCYHEPGGNLILVEGESDCWTLWFYGLPALGIPGVQATSVLEAEHVAGIAKVFVSQESDAAGVNFVQNILTRLKEIHYPGEVRIFSLAPCKDVSELHCADPTKFQTLFQRALDEALDLGTWTARNNPAKVDSGFTLTPLKTLLAQPEVPVDYLVEDRLIVGGVSLCVGKPKSGKSVTARNLSLAVALGTPFLGFQTRMGECIYLALEERAEDVRRDFQMMGATGEEAILIHAAAPPTHGVTALCQLIRERRPALLVGDPLFRLVAVTDENRYAEMYSMLGPIVDAARETGTHVLLCHHSPKTPRLDAIDSPLGSTALGGAVSTVLVLKRLDRYRTIETVQRIGPQLEERVLIFDPDTRLLSLGGSRVEVAAQECAETILDFLKECSPSPKTEPQINDSVEGETRCMRRALRQLVKKGVVMREGTGKRGNPYRYSVGEPGRETPGPDLEIALFDGVAKPPSEEAKPEPSSDTEVI